MRKSFEIGKNEKHRLDFSVNWLTGLFVLSVDGRAVFRRPFFFKVDHTVEVGREEKHLVGIRFNVFDYFGSVLKVTIDGQDSDLMMGIHPFENPDTPADDAAAAILFVSVSNVVFSVIGTLFVPDLDSLETRLLLLVGGLLYLWIFVRILSGSKRALPFAFTFFTLDSALALALSFSVSGLVLRIMIGYYLLTGIRYQREIQSRLR